MTSAEPDRTPRTLRGQRTREQLIESARVVFERQGYAATRMGDIATEAGVSHGTVYTYFETKRDVLAATLKQVEADLRRSIHEVGRDDPSRKLAHANASYVRTYVTHARLFMVMEEAAMGDETFAEALLALRRAHISRVAHQIRRQQQSDLVPPDVSPETAALALCAMVEGFARYWAQSPDPHDPSGAATVTQLWQRALAPPLTNSVHPTNRHLEELNGIHI